MMRRLSEYDQTHRNPRRERGRRRALQPSFGGGEDAFVTKIGSGIVSGEMIPTLSEWGLISMVLLLAALGLHGLRKQ